MKVNQEKRNEMLCLFLKTFLEIGMFGKTEIKGLFDVSIIKTEELSSTKNIDFGCQFGLNIICSPEDTDSIFNMESFEREVFAIFERIGIFNLDIVVINAEFLNKKGHLELAISSSEMFSPLEQMFRTFQKFKIED